MSAADLKSKYGARCAHYRKSFSSVILKVRREAEIAQERETTKDVVLHPWQKSVMDLLNSQTNRQILRLRFTREYWKIPPVEVPRPTSGNLGCEFLQT